MPEDKITVSERFQGWFRSVLTLRNDITGPNLDAEKDAWLDMMGSALGHNVDRCTCVVCQLDRRSDGSHLSMRKLATDRYDYLCEFTDAD